MPCWTLRRLMWSLLPAALPFSAYHPPSEFAFGDDDDESTTIIERIGTHLGQREDDSDDDDHRTNWHTFGANARTIPTEARPTTDALPVVRGLDVDVMTRGAP